MATASLSASQLSNNPHVQRAAEALMFLNLKYGEDAGSDEYGAEAAQILTDCCDSMGFPIDEDTVIETVNELAGKLAHQQAVNVLCELACDDVSHKSLRITYEKLFRLAIDEQRDEQEVAILQCALTLLGQSESEQRAFYDSLAFLKDENGLRVNYDPQSVTVQ
jgi:hypothetical protein